MRKIALMAALAAAGCGEAKPPDIGTTKNEIENIVKQYHEKLSAADLDGAGAFLAPEVSLASKGDVIDFGKDNVMKVLGKYVDIVKSKDLVGKRRATYGRMEITQEGILAMARYEVTFMEFGKPFSEIYTQVFKRMNGKWMIIHEHRSSP